MRQGRNRALQEFRLADEMPFCREEDELEEITSALNHVMVRRVDQSLLRAKRRRIQSRRQIENKEIDEVIAKSLLRLCNAVQDCFTGAHQAAVVRKRTTARRIERTSRESRSKQVVRKRVLQEAQMRTQMRQNRIERDLEAEIRKTTATAIATKQGEVQARKTDRGRRLLDVAEQEFDRIARLEEETTAAAFGRRCAIARQRTAQRRTAHREDVSRSMAALRRGMDHLDSATDAMLHRRFRIDT